MSRRPDARPTARQLEVLQGVADGKSADEIAEELGMAPVTVKTHVSRALSTLGARNRAQAVAMAYREGWIT